MDRKNLFTLLLFFIGMAFLVEVSVSKFSLNRVTANFILEWIFAAGTFVMLFAWPYRIFVVLLALNFVQFNMGMAMNTLVHPHQLPSPLYHGLAVCKWILSAISLLLILLGVQRKVTLGWSHEEVKLPKLALIIIYLAASAVIQLVVR